MVLPILNNHSNKEENLSEANEGLSNVTELNTVKNEESFMEDENWQDEDAMDVGEEEFEDEEPGDDVRDFSQNQVSLTFSWSLMNQLRYLSRTEGIGVEDLLIELVAEGVTKRVFEDQNKPAPSHLMTRNGYVNSGDGNTNHPQPQMSHHQAMNNRLSNGQNNRNKVGMQSRNGQYNNNMRYQNNHSRGYQNNGRTQQGNTVSFRQNGNSSYSSQQRYVPRQTNSNQNSSHTNQTQRFNDNEGNSSQAPKNRKY